MGLVVVVALSSRGPLGPVYIGQREPKGCQNHSLTQQSFLPSPRGPNEKVESERPNSIHRWAQVWPLRLGNGTGRAGRRRTPYDVGIPTNQTTPPLDTERGRNGLLNSVPGARPAGPKEWSRGTALGGCISAKPQPNCSNQGSLESSRRVLSSCARHIAF